MPVSGTKAHKLLGSKMGVMGEITSCGDHGLNSGYMYPKHSGYDMTYRETANTSVDEYQKFDDN